MKAPLKGMKVVRGTGLCGKAPDMGEEVMESGYFDGFFEYWCWGPKPTAKK